MTRPIEQSEPAVVRFLRWHGNTDLPLPEGATLGAAAFDLRAATPAGVTEIILPGHRALIPIGFAVAVPDGYEMQIRPRSGLAMTHGVTVLNAPATIDSDFRGEVHVCLINHGTQPFGFTRGDRVAQALVAQLARVQVVEVEMLDETGRGSGGFGSTGVA